MLRGRGQVVAVPLLPAHVMLVLAQDPGARIDIELARAVAQRDRLAEMRRDPHGAVLDEGPDRDEVGDMVAHVLLHGAGSRQIGGNLRPHLVPRPVDLPLEVTAQRGEVLVEHFRRAPELGAALHPELRQQQIRLARGQHLGVHAARAAVMAHPVAVPGALDDDLEHVFAHDAAAANEKSVRKWPKTVAELRPPPACCAKSGPWPCIFSSCASACDYGPGPRGLDQETAEGKEEERRKARAHPHHPDGAEARRRDRRRRLALLGDPRRDPLPRAADRDPAVHRQGRHRALPAGDGRQAAPGAAAAVPRLPGLALSRRQGRARRPRPRRARRAPHARADAARAARTWASCSGLALAPI